MHASTAYDFLLSSGQKFCVTVTQLNDRADLFSLVYTKVLASEDAEERRKCAQIEQPFDDAGTAIRHGHREAQILAIDANMRLVGIECDNELLLGISDIENATGLPCRLKTA